MRFRGALLSGCAVFVACVALEFVHPWGDVRRVASSDGILAGSSVPSNVRATIETKCGDCHSNRTHWPVYSRLAPASWLMEHDVHSARAAMNLSQWYAISGEDRIAALTRIVAEVRGGQMPPGTYVFLHPANRLTDAEKQEIESWARAERKRLRAATEEKESSGQ